MPSSNVCTPWSTANSALSTSAIGSERLPRLLPSVATSTIQIAVPSAVVTSRASPSGLSAVRTAVATLRPRAGTRSAAPSGGAASSVPVPAPISPHSRA